MSVFSQEKLIRHVVLKGETISKIAEHYNVKPEAIYELNPDAVNGIKLKTVLLIPTKSKKNSASTSVVVTNFPENTHEILPKETLYGITKQYHISVDDLYKINPDLEKEGLKTGQIIKISQIPLDNLVLTSKPGGTKEIQKSNILETNNPKKEVCVSPKLEDKSKISTEGIVYEVLSKESLYSIAKKYGVTIADLQNANLDLKNKALKAGQKITVPIKEDANLSLAVEKVVDKKEFKPEKEVAVKAKPIVEDSKATTETTHEVLPKETKYGIAREYGITVAELERENPDILKNLPIGYILKIRNSKVIVTNTPIEVVVKGDSLENENSNNTVNRVHDIAFVDQLISTATEKLGTPYRSGGITKEGFDCSGLMYFTFSTYDIKLPRSSFEMASCGSKINNQNVQKGDLIFFKTNGRGQINHVGMVVEVLEDEIKFIHSSNHGGVIISSTKESYYEKSLVQVNRIL